MRILLAMPHYYRAATGKSHNRSRREDARGERLRALITAVASLHQTFGAAHYGLDHHHAAAWQVAPTVLHEIDLVVCTSGEAHLLGEAPWLAPLYRHHATAVEPAAPKV
jgi:hypothetical protein